MDGYPINMPRFGDALRALIRRKLHLSMRGFSERSSVSLDTLNRAMKMEDGSGLNPSTYQAIAAGAGMTVEELDAWVQSYTPEPSPIPPLTADGMAYAEMQADRAGMTLQEYLETLLREYGMRVAARPAKARKGKPRRQDV
jgi:transcriptional regulator with XRE-family HTH domain